MRDKKQRHSQKCRDGNCEKGNNGTVLQGVENAVYKPLCTAKRTLSTTLVNDSVVVGSLHVDGLHI